MFERGVIYNLSESLPIFKSFVYFRPRNGRFSMTPSWRDDRFFNAAPDARAESDGAMRLEHLYGPST